MRIFFNKTVYVILHLCIYIYIFMFIYVYKHMCMYIYNVYTFIYMCIFTCIFLIYVHKFCWTWGERLKFTKTGMQLYDCMSGLSQAMNLGMFHDFSSSGFVWCDDGFVSTLQLEMCLNFQVINILVGSASKV